MTGTLYIVATPIGNLSDITFRAIEVLKNVSLIAAEDTRVTHKLLSRYEITTPMISYREQNAARTVPDVITRLQTGQDVAVVSDAGTPSISDPGSDLVRAAVDVGISVSPIPGPSALSAAVSASALDGEGVRFVGFLPRKGKSRNERICTIAQDRSCSVIYESPHRLHQTLLDLHKECGNRMAVVFRELTKLHEEIKKGTLQELATAFQGNVRGEVTLMVEGNLLEMQGEISAQQLESLIVQELQKGKSVKDISAALSTALGMKKKRIYDLAVSLVTQQNQ